MQEDLALLGLRQPALAGPKALGDIRRHIRSGAVEVGALPISQPCPDDEPLTSFVGADGAVDEVEPSRRSIEPLEQDLDLPAARQPDAPAGLICHAEREGLDLAVGEDVLGFGNDIALVTAARDGA